jgi:hypothetical protein
MNNIRFLLAAFAFVGVGLTGGCSDSSPPKAPEPGASPVAAPTVTVLKWGPQSTKAGTGFAVQSNGNSALWFEQRGLYVAGSVEVWFNQTRLQGVALKPNEAGSAEVPPELLTKAGKYPLHLKLQPSGQRVELGVFEVTP